MDDDSDEDSYRNIIEIIDYSSDDDDDNDDPLRGIPTLSPEVASQKYVQNQTFGPCKYSVAVFSCWKARMKCITATSYNSLKRSRPSSPDIKPLKAVKNEDKNVKIVDFSSDDDDELGFGDDEYKVGISQFILLLYITKSGYMKGKENIIFKTRNGRIRPPILLLQPTTE